MEDDLLTILRTSKIFSSLPPRVCRKIAPKFEKIELQQDEILYYQGDIADSIEIVLSGKLVALLTTMTGETNIVGEIEPGETVGELGALSNQPRTTTVKAVKDSVVFKLPAEVFIELCHEYPAVLFAIINPILTRSHKIIQLFSTEKFKKHVAIIPANADVSLTEFSQKIIEEFSGHGHLIILSDYEENTFDSAEKIQAHLEEIKLKNPKKVKQKILYILKSNETPLAKSCFERIDMLYVIANHDSPVLLNNFAIEKLNLSKIKNKIKPELILLHPDETRLPRNTSYWLQLTEFRLHHHVRINRSKDLHRLMRFIRNKAVGLVLSGGGTRGWGHIGAIKALLEAGIPIDAIGGTSVGAIIAASYALTESNEKTLAQFIDIIEGSRDSVTWRSITWPAISIFNGKGLTTGLNTVFNDIRIENLWLNFYCISTNLAKNIEAIHTHGLLWEKIRASVSIPGVIPPMLLNGELHFDGGLLNNLPIDVMRKIVGHRGNVIGIELGGSIKDEHKYDFPPILTFWQTLFAKLGRKHIYKFPRFIDTFLKSMLVGSSLKSQQNILASNLIVTLDLSRFPMLHSSKKLENKIIDIGFETTIDQLKNMQRKKIV